MRPTIVQHDRNPDKIGSFPNLASSRYGFTLLVLAVVDQMVVFVVHTEPRYSSSVLESPLIGFDSDQPQEGACHMMILRVGWVVQHVNRNM